MGKKNPYTKDAGTRRAKEQGYPARSVFKLEEIDKRLKLLKPGQHVLDLGAAPGSWSLYASQRIGPSGKLLAVDLKAIEQAFAPNVELIEGDALDLNNDALGRFAPYDLVLSDMAPSTSGNKLRDQALSTELFLRALAVAAALGKAGSAFVGKIFMSGDFQSSRAELQKHYQSVKTIRPEGTRKVSTELFCVGLGLKPASVTAGSAL